MRAFSIERMGRGRGSNICVILRVGADLLQCHRFQRIVNKDCDSDSLIPCTESTTDCLEPIHVVLGVHCDYITLIRSDLVSHTQNASNSSLRFQQGPCVCAAFGVNGEMASAVELVVLSSSFHFL